MWAKAYADHVNELGRRTESALEATGFDGLLIHSGTPLRYFADDYNATFRATPHFLHWLPLESPGHVLLVRPGEKPFLVRYAPEDYWFEQAPLGDRFWTDAFEIREVGKEERVFEEIPRDGRYAFVGDCPAVAEKHGFAAESINPSALVARLDWSRSYKTPYEVACMERATREAARAHKASREAFNSGGSELEIHHAYLQAVGCAEAELPYTNIIALNEKAAILHYEGKRKAREGKVLLMDCGARHLSYASDITRTWTHPSCDELFREMVSRFDELQRSLSARVRPGLPFPELHFQAHLGIGGFLRDFGILRVSGEDAVERRLTQAFFPHGLGHYLGIQVHDVSGHQREPSGGAQPPPPEHPFLRTTRILEESQVITMEPGMYFIEMLLRPHRDGPDRDAFDWPLIERLSPCGGIRIEDNLVVTAEGVRNLTREHLP